MAVSTQLIIACWIIYFVYWIASARGVKPVAERSNMLSILCYRAPLFLGGVLLCFPKPPPPLNLALTPHTGLAQAIAVVVCIIGLSAAIWSRRILAGNWSADVTFKQGHQLIQTGPYRFARHPIYTGILLMCLGTVILAGWLHCWLGLVIIFAGLWIKLKQEESLMARHFPGDYPSYRSRVKALVPFVI
jgi:protein-S-isoprenylcysteine O-methyltransferase Ste14